MRPIAITGVLTAGILQALLGAAADRVVLRAEAGLGGFVRQGRWAPVRIEIDSTEELTADVIVEWGDVRVHRTIDVPSPSRTAFELYVRTTDVRGSMTVRVVEKGASVVSVEVPVRNIPDDELLIVCAGDAPTAGVGPCTTTIATETLPRSLRGYAAASDVRLPAGAHGRLNAAQRTALQRWRAYEALHAQDLVSQAPRAPLGAAGADREPRPARVAAATALALLGCCAWIWMRGGAAARWSYVALTCATASGVLAVKVAGRYGPGSAILLRHATTVEQVGDGALVSMRGTLVYPAFSGYTVRVLRLDGDLMPRHSTGEEVWLDASGAPIHQGTFGRGAREEIEVDGVADYAPFRVRLEGDVVQVHNASETTLTDCSFPEGFSDRDAGTLAPGASVTARALAPGDAPFFSCALAQPPLTFTEARFPVHVQGTAVVSVKLPDGWRKPAVK